MNGWMDRCKDRQAGSGQLDRWKAKQTEGLVDRWINRTMANSRMEKRMERHTDDVWTDRQMDVWTDRWMYGRTDRCKKRRNSYRCWGKRKNR
jgi:hypothetical protein